MPASRKADKSATDNKLAELCRTKERLPHAQLNGNAWKIEREARDTENTMGVPHNAVAFIVNISTSGGKFVIGKVAPDRSGVQVVDEVAVVDAEQLMI
ncbi:hypothetical protein MMC29_002120 [Sticta canariensis]|nr:hypothetical protein [Sticta canariensis]